MRNWLLLAFFFFLVVKSSPPIPPPNIILILTDDQDLLLNSMDYMPLVKKYLIERGATFPNYFIPTPVCCPSRASILRGQFAHNTQIIDLAEPGGGGKRFRALGLENSTIATWLQKAGYRTALHGKYLNQYPCKNSWIPPGWDDWFALCTPQIYNYYDSNYNENGEIKNVQEYQSDTIGIRAQKFIEESHAQKVPFFLHLSFVAPHAPAKPAEKYKKMFADVKLPRTPSYNQSDTRNMPSFLQNLPYFNTTDAEDQEKHYRNRLRSLQSVDEYVEKIVNTLQSLNILRTTYIVYTSDNGYHIGQHRQKQGKRSPYEEDIRVPFIIRGPMVRYNITIPGNVLNIDIAPTLAELGNAKIPDFVDGKSILPLIRMARNIQDPLEFANTVNTFRPYILLEHWGIASGKYENNTWQALRIHNTTSDIVYTSWCVPKHEFYNISGDPYQLNNTYGFNRTYDVMHEYDSILRQMFFCHASECNEINAPLPLAEFLPTALTPCFNGKNTSVLPNFHVPNKHRIDYTKELPERESDEIDNEKLDFSYVSMFVVVLFVLLSVYMCFTFRKKIALALKQPSKNDIGANPEIIGAKQVRKRLLV